MRRTKPHVDELFNLMGRGLAPGIESAVMGRPAPDHTPPDFEHVKNEVGQHNEVWVDS